MIRRPPRSTLFPTRRSSDLYCLRWPPASSAIARRRRSRSGRGRCRSSPQAHRRRSEEHTSELQSPDHLVCRLLLEKKKKECLSLLVSSNCGTKKINHHLILQ